MRMIRLNGWMQLGVPLYVIALTALLAGCASHSSVAPMSEGKFMVTKQAASGLSDIGNFKAELTQEAVSFCSAMDKNMSQVAYDESKPAFISGSYPRAELQFSCTVKPSIPEQSGRKGG